MAKEKYGYAESSNLIATRAGHVFDMVDMDNALENGMLVKLGELVDEPVDGLEVRTAEKAAIGDKVALILSDLIAYDQTTTEGQAECYLRREAGEPARAYMLFEEDRFAVADYCITPISADNGPAEGNIVVLNPTNRFMTEMAKGADISTYGFAARIERITFKTNMKIVRVRVIKNEAVVSKTVDND